jgi:hypothetical protein
VACPSLIIADLLGRSPIIFENNLKDSIALPDPKFIMIHAAIAKVLFSSGAGNYLDRVIDTFRPASLSVLPGILNLDIEDLELLLSVLSLAEAQPSY